MNNVKVSFLIRNNKQNRSGSCPIYLRITVNGKRSEISTKKYIEPAKWSSVAQKVRGSSPTANALNSYLEQLSRKVLETETMLLKEGSEITARSIKYKIIGNNQEYIDLFKLFEDHNSKMKELIGKEFALSTYKKYTTCLMHLREFVKENYNQNHFSVKSVNLEFIKRFEHYLKTKENSCSHNSALKYISHLKKIIREAKSFEYIEKDPFVGFKESYNTKDPIYLTYGELNQISAKIIEIPRVDRVRDIFLFSCYTGLSYSDVYKLKKSDVQKDAEGEKWLVINRTKTKEPSYILLLDLPLEIIGKYSNDPETSSGNLLPVLSNQKMNAYLKEIADICGIRKSLTFHMARHTFATTVALENGMSISSVQKVLGHKDPRSTKHYARVTRKKVGDEMKILKNKIALQMN